MFHLDYLGLPGAQKVVGPLERLKPRIFFTAIISTCVELMEMARSPLCFQQQTVSQISILSSTATRFQQSKTNRAEQNLLLQRAGSRMVQIKHITKNSFPRIRFLLPRAVVKIGSIDLAYAMLAASLLSSCHHFTPNWKTWSYGASYCTKSFPFAAGILCLP